jgi:hypothetical protein
MAAPRLSVNGYDAAPSSGWKTVVAPYINVGGGTSGWKAVQNVWIKNGGTWKLTHKTAKTDSSIYSAQSSTTFTSSFSYTVPSDGTRYLEVTMHGHNGGGGAGVTSINTKEAPGGPVGHRTCPYPSNWTDTVSENACGGVGGVGGLANVVLEVRPGEVYKGSFEDAGGSSYGTSAAHKDWDLSYDTNESVGATLTGNYGGAAAAISFVDHPYSDTSLLVMGGGGGQGGVLTITGNCYSGGARGYAVSTTTGANGSNGSWLVQNGSRIWQTISSGVVSGTGGTAGCAGTEAHLGGAVTTYSGDGSTGSTSPFIKIIPYKSNYGTI